MLINNIEPKHSIFFNCILNVLVIVFENDVLLVRTSGNFALVSGLLNDDIVLTNGQAFVSPGDEIVYKIN